ncbi:ankyrin repeat-containing domain protein [Pelagophyceae sp. CCMP2097]|nr:ankyrin repeat-containing domain protein [Pelagophyceae sp. CCMP2097]
MQSDVSANTKTAMGAVRLGVVGGRFKRSESQVRLGDAALAGDALTQKRSIYETVRSDPLHVAAWRGDLATVKVLLANGAYVRDTDAGGRSALHLVCDGSRPHFSGAGGRCAIVALLLDSGADVDASDDRGDSPLHCACRSGDAQLVHLLVSRGADATVANRRGASCGPSSTDGAPRLAPPHRVHQARLPRTSGSSRHCKFRYRAAGTTRGNWRPCAAPRRSWPLSSAPASQTQSRSGRTRTTSSV